MNERILMNVATSLVASKYGSVPRFSVVFVVVLYSRHVYVAFVSVCFTSLGVLQPGSVAIQCKPLFGARLKAGIAVPSARFL